MKRIVMLILSLAVFVGLSIIPMSGYAANASLSTDYTDALKSLENAYNVKIYIDPDYDGPITTEQFNTAKTFLQKAQNAGGIQIYGTTDVRGDTVAISSTTYTVSGTTSVWAGIPAIGWCYVNTPYTIRYIINQYGYHDIQSCSMGTSYITGVAMATWQHYSNSWSKIGYSTARISSTGLLSWGIPGTPLYYQSLETFQSDVSI